MTNKESYFAIVSSKNLGYTNSTRALACVHGEFKEFDAVMDDEVKQPLYNNKFVENLKSQLSQDNNKDKVVLISSAKYGLDFFNDVILKDDELNKNYLEGKINFVWTSDRAYDVDLAKFKKGMTIIMPEKEMGFYKEQIKGLPIKVIGVDLVAAIDAKSTDASASEFEMANPEVASAIKNFNNKITEFLGGRVQLPDGSWKENSVDVFVKEANDLLSRAKGENILIATHGLRTFTDADKKNDFTPYNAFIDTIKDGLSEEQMVMLITKDANEDGSRTSALHILGKRNGKIGSYKEAIKDVGNSYNFVLKDTIRKGAKAVVTAEQMNFPSEFMSLGGDGRNIEPSIWDLTVQSNIEAYEVLSNKTKAGLKIVTAKDAYSDLIKKSGISNIVMAKATAQQKR